MNEHRLWCFCLLFGKNVFFVKVATITQNGVEVVRGSVMSLPTMQSFAFLIADIGCKDDGIIACHAPRAKRTLSVRIWVTCKFSFFNVLFYHVNSICLIVFHVVTMYSEA
jgi:hypothetical protein